MKIFILFSLLFSTVAWSSVKEIYLPSLNCGSHEFQDVSITFEDSLQTRKELTILKLCEKLALKLFRRPRNEAISRFVTESLAPKHMDKFMPRANDFFRLILFKGNIMKRTEFDFTDQKLPEILQSLLVKAKLRVSIFEPDESQLLTIAYHQGGIAYFNKHKLERSACSLINTLVHEYMHFLGYSHGDNLPNGKENSVPYYFGNRAQELCEAGVI